MMCLSGLLQICIYKWINLRHLRLGSAIILWTNTLSINFCVVKLHFICVLAWNFTFDKISCTQKSPFPCTKEWFHPPLRVLRGRCDSWRCVKRLWWGSDVELGRLPRWCLRWICWVVTVGSCGWSGWFIVGNRVEIQSGDQPLEYYPRNVKEIRPLKLMIGRLLVVSFWGLPTFGGFMLNLQGVYSLFKPWILLGTFCLEVFCIKTGKCRIGPS